MTDAERIEHIERLLFLVADLLLMIEPRGYETGEHIERARERLKVARVAAEAVSHLGHITIMPAKAE